MNFAPVFSAGSVANNLTEVKLDPRMRFRLTIPHLHFLKLPYSINLLLSGRVEQLYQFAVLVARVSIDPSGQEQTRCVG